MVFRAQTRTESFSCGVHKEDHLGRRPYGLLRLLRDNGYHTTGHILPKWYIIPL